MSFEERKDLTSSEKKLLTSYFDNESGFIKSILARKLLKDSKRAREYLKELEEVSRVCRDFFTKEVYQKKVLDKKEEDSFSSTVLRRIEEEEKREALLGKREVEKRARSYIFGIKPLSTAAAAACLVIALMFFIPKGKDNLASLKSKTLLAKKKAVATAENQVKKLSSKENKDPIFPEIVPTVQVVSTSKRRRVGETVLQSKVLPFQSEIYSEFQRNYLRDKSIAEIDWVRSTGRARVLQSPGEKNPIIWIEPYSLYNGSRSQSLAKSRLRKVYPLLLPNLRFFK
ncbi:MAG: hypothetical protein D6780_01580 [Candidatus Dadabacteria bacterium]|nr:MAG: hypothetical protein D6780_01580 [Candidatus Dadabacteria bacterium]